MGKLLQLLTRNGGFMTFLLVEMFSFYLIVQYNDQQDAIFTHTMGLVGGNVLEKRNAWVSYAHLRVVSDSLASENIILRKQLADARNIQVPYRDTFFIRDIDSLIRTDSLRRVLVKPQFEFISARVIGNSINSANNWLTINRGSNENVRPGMGVISKDGVVGIARHVTPNFSMVMSILHRQTKISVGVKRLKKALGSLVWEGGDPSVMTLKFIARHFDVKPGDLIVTSGYSEIFPKDIEVGRVEGAPEQDPANPYCWIMKVRLNQDMSTLDYVYVVNDIFHTELDSLKLKVKNEQ